MAETVIQEKKGNPPRVVWHIYRGNTFVSDVIRFEDDNGDPLDISGYSFECEFRRSRFQNTGDPEIGNAEFILGQSDAAVTAAVAKDEVVVKFDKQYTNVVEGKYEGDFRTVDGSGDRKTPFRIMGRVHEDVSNPTP